MAEIAEILAEIAEILAEINKKNWRSPKNISKTNISENKTENVKRSSETRDVNESNSSKESQFGQCYIVEISITILISQSGS